MRRLKLSRAIIVTLLGLTAVVYRCFGWDPNTGSGYPGYSTPDSGGYGYGYPRGAAGLTPGRFRMSGGSVPDSAFSALEDKGHFGSPYDHHPQQGQFSQGYRFREISKHPSAGDEFPKFRPETMKGRSPYSWGAGEGAMSPAPVFRETGEYPKREGGFSNGANLGKPSGTTPKRSSYGTGNWGEQGVYGYLPAPVFRPLP